MTMQEASTPIDFTRLAPPSGARMLVIGGCGGIGQALVNAALMNGLEVAVFDLPASLKRHDLPPAVLKFEVDVTDEDQVKGAYGRLGERWEGIDALVNTVGVGVSPPRRFETFSGADWSRFLSLNLLQMALICTNALPLLKKGRNASITAIGSLHGTLPPEGFGPYGAAKAGVANMIKGLALENAPAIRANCVAPSGMLTPFLAGGTGHGGEDGDTSWLDTEALTEITPLKRLCTPEDVAAVCLFMASPGARYITGQTIQVSGGRVMP
ncbi:NAD(P)-dependent dehydrogenase (short-subunit alcohol dehydrogenase family) [Paraburkholderia sp. BL23I1N1]|nr:NAD(P)-dependent dehydrogenase (short-subunit alcohol dehydrogenase family) [Paraburkholderia sp. BL23I1N1]